jgi:poly(3-hydroxybutyrate) depolymerase
MKYLVAVAALACVASTSASAKPREAMQSFTVAAAQDPYGVYVDGQLIGRDPDPAVRAEIRAAYCGKYAPVGGAK